MAQRGPALINTDPSNLKGAASEGLFQAGRALGARWVRRARLEL